MPHDQLSSNDLVRLRYDLFVIVVAFVFLLGVAAAAIWKWSRAPEASALVGSVAGLVGAVVGAYFGMRAGAAGSAQVERARQDAENARARAELRALRLAGVTDPERAHAALACDTWARVEPAGPVRAGAGEGKMRSS